MTAPASGWQQLALALFRRIRADLTEALADADADADSDSDATALDHRAADGVNTAGWLAWHIARGQDRNLSEIAGRPQLWLTGGWADRFHRPPDPAETGFGHTTAQAAAFRSPPAAVLLGYLDATYHLAEEYLTAAPDADADRLVVSPTLGNEHTVQARLTGLIRDCFEHTGQIALLLGPLGAGAVSRTGRTAPGGSPPAAR